jgi:hypothetical protein
VIQNAEPGDTLLIGPGLYYENLDLPAGDWTLLASSIAGDEVILDGRDGGAVISGSGAGRIILEGLTIQRGTGERIDETDAMYAGGGLCLNALGIAGEVEARNCTFRSNRVGGAGGSTGGAVYLSSYTARFVGCSFEENYAAHSGSVFGAEGTSRLALVECTISNNLVDLPVGSLIDGAALGNTIQSCVIRGPGGHSRL